MDNIMTAYKPHHWVAGNPKNLTEHIWQDCSHIPLEELVSHHNIIKRKSNTKTISGFLAKKIDIVEIVDKIIERIMK